MFKEMETKEIMLVEGGHHGYAEQPGNQEFTPRELFDGVKDVLIDLSGFGI